MAPSAIEPQTVPEFTTAVRGKTGLTRQPLEYSGSLDQFEYIEVTPHIGREYTNIDVVTDLLQAPNSDQRLRDLAIIASTRGVVFFRKQDNVKNDAQKQLVERMGRLTGVPDESGLYIHPSIDFDRNRGREDLHITTISSVETEELFRDRFAKVRSNVLLQKKSYTPYWHSDIAFENVPAAYSCLRLEQLGSTGGDTLWSNAYELYDRLSAPIQKMLDGLTCSFPNPGFEPMFKSAGIECYSGKRGHPLNVGKTLGATHPMVRTNPVTGWKALYGVGHHEQRPYINELTPSENKRMCDWLEDLVQNCHDCQARFRWNSPNDIALWDNRSTFHTATMDTAGQGPRFGQRTIIVGEKPYLDPASQARRDALGLWRSSPDPKNS